MITINQPFFTDKSLIDVQAVIESGQWVASQNVAALEDTMCKITGMRYGVCVANATMAIELAIQCLNPHHEAEIITPSFTYKSAITAILKTQCKPIFIDINDQYVVDTDLVRDLVTNNTIAIIGTDMFGFPCDSLALRKVANECGLDFIEDASQAIGAKIMGNHVGLHSDIAVFSFYATKNIGSGEGGILLTNDEIIYDRAFTLREANLLEIQTTLESKMMVGSNLRMSEITAPLAIEGIANMSNIVASRRRNAMLMQKYLDISHPHFADGRLSSWNTFPIIHDDRDGLKDWLESYGIQAKIYYDYLVNYDPIFIKYNGLQETPKSLEVSKKIISLPVHQGLNEINMRNIAEKVKTYESTT